MLGKEGFESHPYFDSWWLLVVTTRDPTMEVQSLIEIDEERERERYESHRLERNMGIICLVSEKVWESVI